MVQPRELANTLSFKLGRRTFLQAAVALGTLSATGCAAHAQSSSGSSVGSSAPTKTSAGILQPNQGSLTADHYLESTPESVLWGYVPSIHSAASMQMKSGQTVTVDTVSHEGILEDQGRNPDEFFGSHGVSQDQVLEDARAIAAEYNRTPRNFDSDGPHIVTGPIFVEDAQPGDVLKVETLSTELRVPYGVVSSRHGRGALGQTKDGSAPAGIDISEVMPPTSTDGRSSGIPSDYGNVSVFTSVEDDMGIMGDRIRFPLRPFMGMMGVAFADGDVTSPQLNSIPPTLGGGNIDIRHLAVGSAFYLPVRAEGALFYTGDPHMGMGDGEVSLTAMEGSLRTTFRLTVCKKDSGDAPSVAFNYPFAENDEYWIPIGLSDPDGSTNEQNNDLNAAMRRAVVNALDFLQTDMNIERHIAYAYLSAAADFAISQVVDRTTGVHGLIRKSDFV
ncbi:hypothetical protein CDES_00495 [Corynebacterium deserti GIMN1.010]|uniref:Acetamidase/formamidase n=1 Tax=Corynebacterium deserti GIMN1.010 TaxID=931089 RepID=A0A0M4CVC6_9CORY|nr:acetamidase/formamidase family protein [Corynebacterium deserti]ALC04582.1 hypothetical protein CDES_00495 [Corynebacterium deserti GIMN1.010]